MGILAGCTTNGGCPANIDCAYPPGTTDPIASTDPGQYDIYDACIVDGLAAAGFTDPWVGLLMKGQALQEGGSIVSVVTSDTNECGGQNCGMISISAGAASGDTMPGGVCGVTQTDPLTGKVDYSHSYGLFQDTPGCEGTFLIPTLPSGYTCTGTGTGDIVPFSTSQKAFYCESETSLGVMNLTGQTVKGVIDAVMDSSDPYYKQSIFYPAYNLFVHMGYTFANEYKQVNAGVTGCDPYQMMFKVIAYWLNGDLSTSCNVPSGREQGGDLNYVQNALGNYQMLTGQAWPYEQPMD